MGILENGRFCPYCGKPLSILISNYDLPTNVSNEVHLTSGTISTYVTTGSVTVAAAEQYPNSPFLNFGAREFKTRLAEIPDEFAQKIREGEVAIRKYNEEINRRNCAAEITNLIGSTNVAFDGKRQAMLFREDDLRVIAELHSPCENEAHFVSKLARLATLFEVSLAPLRSLVSEPGELRSIKLVEKWLQENNIAFDPDMIRTWTNIINLRNMEPLHARLEAEDLLEIADFFGTTLPLDFPKLWDGILSKFLQSLREWHRILKEL